MAPFAINQQIKFYEIISYSFPKVIIDITLITNIMNVSLIFFTIKLIVNYKDKNIIIILFFFGFILLKTIAIKCVSIFHLTFPTKRLLARSIHESLLDTNGNKSKLRTIGRVSDLEASSSLGLFVRKNRFCPIKNQARKL